MVAGRYLFAGAAAALFLGVSFEAPAQDAVCPRQVSHDLRRLP